MLLLFGFSLSSIYLILLILIASPLRLVGSKLGMPRFITECKDVFDCVTTLEKLSPCMDLSNSYSFDDMDLKVAPANSNQTFMRS